jgi:hypothetical protein
MTDIRKLIFINFRSRTGEKHGLNTFVNCKGSIFLEKRHQPFHFMRRMFDAIQQNPASLAYYLKKSSFFENKVANCLLLKLPYSCR